MKAPQVITIDFETHGIESRPAYPPKPVGVSIQWPNERKPTYWAWGHPTGNNCDRRQAYHALQAAWDSDVPKLFHNAKFDIDVAAEHFGLRDLQWQEFHDTMFLAFLDDPHALELGLKPRADKLLGIAPEERDAVKEWLIENKCVPKGEKWGAHMASAPGTIVGKYANGDVMRTLKLFQFLYPRILKEGMLSAYNRERRLLPILLANERQGLRVDVKLLEQDIAIYHKAMFTIECWLRRRLNVDNYFNFDSDADVGEKLDNLGIVTEWAMTKTGKRSVAKKNMTIDKFNDKKVFYALGYRNRLKTCLSMFMEPWLQKAIASGGYINPNWNQVRQPKGEGDSQGTRTGRPSCTDPNLLNVSKSFYDRGDHYDHPKFLRSLPELPLTRRYILPDKGHKWLHRDYNQQELRILAHFEEGAILKAYQKDPDMDIHTFVQSEIKRLMKRDIDRSSVKTMNFGKLYGQGLGSLAEKLDTTVEEVKSIRDSQNKALPGLKELEDAIKATSKAGNPIVTWGGRVYYVEPPKFVEKFGREMTFEYKLINYLVQGSAADATKEAIIRYNDAKDKGRFLVTVYDEINISAPAGDRAVKREMKILQECMEGLDFDVHMKSDGKVGDSWGNLTKYQEK